MLAYDFGLLRRGGLLNHVPICRRVTMTTSPLLNHSIEHPLNHPLLCAHSLVLLNWRSRPQHQTCPSIPSFLIDKEHIKAEVRCRAGQDCRALQIHLAFMIYDRAQKITVKELIGIGCKGMETWALIFRTTLGRNSVRFLRRLTQGWLECHAPSTARDRSFGRELIPPRYSGARLLGSYRPHIPL